MVKTNEKTDTFGTHMPPFLFFKNHMMNKLRILSLYLCYTSYAQQLLPMGEGIKCQGLINSLCVDSLSGKIYAGGYFDAMNELKADNIAVWNGLSWDSLQSGVQGAVYHLQCDNGTLYCSGNFTIDGNPLIANLASWDGSQWQVLYTIPPNGAIWCSKMYKGALYVSGSFLSIDGVNAQYIAKYQNGIWSGIGTGFNYPPDKMEIVHDTLFFGGNFTTWNGDSVRAPAWVDGAGNTGGIIVPNGISYNSKELFSLNDTLYSIVNDTIVWWSGQQRIATYYFPVYIDHAFSHLGNIFITYDSTYTASSTTTKDNIIRKIDNGQLAERVCYSRITGTGATFLPEYYAFLSYDSALYIAGNFYSINNEINPGILRYKNQVISNIGKCASAYVDSWQNASVTAITEDTSTGNIYVGGYFIFAGNKLSPMIAMWDGNQWHPLDSGLSGTVRSLAFYNGQLYAGGSFRYAGTTLVSGLARWNGVSWQGVSTGTDKSVYKLLVVGNDLFIAGTFSNIGGNFIEYVARYDGTSFYDMNTGLQFWGTGVYDLAWYHNKLYASSFHDDLYFLNGNNWIPYGLPSEPRKMLILNDTLIVGGQTRMYKVTDNSMDTLSMVNAWYWNYFNPLNLQQNLFSVDSDYGIFKEEHDTLWLKAEGIFPYASLNLDSTHTMIGGFFPEKSTATGTRQLNNIGILDFGPPAVTISSNKDSICEFQYIFYYSETDDLFAQYDWDFPGGLPDSSSHVRPIIQYITAGNYPASLSVTNLTGTNTYYLPDTIQVTACITSLEEESEKVLLQLYPNPFSHEFSISNHTTKDVQVFIRTVQGTLVQSIQISGNEHRTCYAAHLADGLYLVEMIHENFHQNMKLIKQ